MYKYEIVPDGTGFSVGITFSINSKQVESINPFFFSGDDAYTYVEKHMTRWIHDTLVKIVSHSENVKHCSFNGEYKNKRRKMASNRLKAYIRTSETETLRGITMQVLNYEQDLRAILPFPTNPSYQKSLNKLDDLVSVCLRIRKQLKKAI